MLGATAPGLATCTLILLGLDVVTWILRFYVRISRKAWGPDDWSMVAAIPLYMITTVGQLGVAFTGGGKHDVDLSVHQHETAMFWWFIMQTMWCLAAVPVKWAICFTLLRIANGQKRYTIGIYGCMASIAIVLCATTIYEFFHCHPLQKNWMIMEGGSCNDQSIISGFSFALSAVSIFSDWFCAVVPIPLLWNVQMDGRIKLSVMGLLSLGVFASIAPLVRLSYTVHLGMTEDFLFNAMDVASWAQAELGLGIIVANLPPLRPLLEKVLSLRSTLKSSDKRSKQKSTGDRYLELEEGVSTTSKKQKSKISHKGPQTRIYGGTGASNSSMEDDHSQKNIVPTSPTPEQQSDGIMVDRQVHVEFSTSPTPHS